MGVRLALVDDAHGLALAARHAAGAEQLDADGDPRLLPQGVLRARGEAGAPGTRARGLAAHGQLTQA
jgi:hypothetical protein